MQTYPQATSGINNGEPMWPPLSRCNVVCERLDVGAEAWHATPGAGTHWRRLAPINILALVSEHREFEDQQASAAGRDTHTTHV